MLTNKKKTEYIFLKPKLYVQNRLINFWKVFLYLKIISQKIIYMR